MIRNNPSHPRKSAPPGASVFFVFKVLLSYIQFPSIASTPGAALMVMGLS
jgi:hypothetical protein